MTLEDARAEYARVCDQLEQLRKAMQELSLQKMVLACDMTKLLFGEVETVGTLSLDEWKQRTVAGKLAKKPD